MPNHTHTMLLSLSLSSFLLTNDCFPRPLSRSMCASYKHACQSSQTRRQKEIEEIHGKSVRDLTQTNLFFIFLLIFALSNNRSKRIFSSHYQ